jgi:hypothetical protein
VVATVNNEHLVQMARLTPHFERAHPDIQVAAKVHDPEHGVCGICLRAGLLRELGERPDGMPGGD